MSDTLMIHTYRVILYLNAMITSLTQLIYLPGWGSSFHPIKSVLQPTQILIFLGFVRNSVNMTVNLTPEKINRINDKCFELLSEVNMTIHDLAEVIGLLVSSFPGVLYGPLFL